jgi:hypothetical protein
MTPTPTIGAFDFIEGTYDRIQALLATSTDHHVGRFETWEWPAGASSLRFGESKTPKAMAKVGLSSTAPMVLPQIGQKARLDQSDERHMEGVPPGSIH